MIFPKQDNAAQCVANAKKFCVHASLCIWRGSESIRIAFLRLLSLALGGKGNLAGTYLFFWGFRRRVGEDFFSVSNFILGLQKTPKLRGEEGSFEKAKHDSLKHQPHMPPPLEPKRLKNH